MPQSDPRFFASQFFWIVICFALFYASVRYLIVPRLFSILEMRGNVNENNKATAHTLSSEIADLRSSVHNKTIQMQNQIEELKAKYEQKFQEYSKNTLDEFNNKIKLSYDAAMLEVEKHQKMLKEKATGEYVANLADKVIWKLTGVKS